jgi:hypothetical protein
VCWPLAVAAPAIVELVEPGVTAVEGEVVEGEVVAMLEASDVGELAVPFVVGSAVAGAVDLKVPGAPEAPGPVVPVMSNDVTTASCPASSVHGTSSLPG